MGNCLGAYCKNHIFVPTSKANVPLGGIHLPIANNGPSSAPLSSQKNDKLQPLTLPDPSFAVDALSSLHLKAFTYHELKNVTKNFKNVLGEGGFGVIYLGWMNPQNFHATHPGEGVPVAVKMLKPDGFQGYKEWLCEVKYLGRLCHQNLVKLLGYCLDGDKQLLVYEYMANHSLEDHLFKKRGEPLSWATRMKIVIGAARGLSFLHESELHLIYRDLKASNILLDSEFNAKLSDFGFAKAGPTGDKNHVTTQVLGTCGYAAPEYIATGKLTLRCDVYSFGVVLLELLSGRRAVDDTKLRSERNLVEWATPYLRDKRKLFRIMDISLEGRYPQKAALTVANVALVCIGDAKLRPSMIEVLACLENLGGHNEGEKKANSSDRHQAIVTRSQSSPPGNCNGPHQSPSG